MTLLLLFVFGFVGLFFHWLVAWSKGNIQVDFVDYLRSERKHTAGSVGAVVAAIASMYSLGDVVANNQTLATAFLLGYTLDNAFNKAPQS